MTIGSTVPSRTKSSREETGIRTCRPIRTNLIRRSAMSRRGNRSEVPKTPATSSTLNSLSMPFPPAVMPPVGRSGGRLPNDRPLVGRPRFADAVHVHADDHVRLAYLGLGTSWAQRIASEGLALDRSIRADRALSRLWSLLLDARVRRPLVVWTAQSLRWGARRPRELRGLAVLRWIPSVRRR